MSRRKETPDEMIGRVAAEHINANTAKGLDSTGTPYRKISRKEMSNSRPTPVEEHRDFRSFVDRISRHKKRQAGGKSSKGLHNGSSGQLPRTRAK